MITIMLRELVSLPHVEREFRKDQNLFCQGDPVTSIFLIRTGEARLIRRRTDGGIVVLQRAPAGAVLAEASLFAEIYHCDGLAVTDVSALAISRAAIRNRFETGSAFASFWAVHLGNEIRATRLRSEILAMKTVAERLDAWVAQRDGAPERGMWNLVAEEIGVSPEALYRELARRRARGK